MTKHKVKKIKFLNKTFACMLMAMVHNNDKYFELHEKAVWEAHAEGELEVGREPIFEKLESKITQMHPHKIYKKFWKLQSQSMGVPEFTSNQAEFFIFECATGASRIKNPLWYSSEDEKLHLEILKQPEVFEYRWLVDFCKTIIKYTI